MPTVMRWSRNSQPISVPGLTLPPLELKKTGRQEVVQALWSVGIEPTFGGDPFAATRAAGIGRPLGHEEDHRLPAQSCVLLWIRLGARVARSLDQAEREQGREREQQSKYGGAHSATIKNTVGRILAVFNLGFHAGQRISGFR
jgi:hypothetical protein